MNETDAERDSLRVSKLLFTELTSLDLEGNDAMQSLGRTLNISTGGILLEMAKDTPLQLRVNLRLGIKDDIVEIEGNVVHLSKTETGEIELGIEFINPTDNQKKIIKRAIATTPE